MIERARAVARKFALDGSLADVRPYGTGLINDTYLVSTDSAWKGILQRINGEVFREPARVQSNLRTVLDHVDRKQAAASRILHLPSIVPTREGADCVSDASGIWRLSNFIAGSVSFDVPSGAAQAREIGWALGRFHALVSDLAPDLLHDTLPGFHVAPGYLDRLDQVLAEHVGQRPLEPETRACLEFVDGRRGRVGVLEEAKARGWIRPRVIHGDPKLNNVLFDAKSGKALSLIDLDTVKPGLIHYDLGDCLRSCCNRTGEQAKGDCAVHFDLQYCRGVLDSYFAEAGATLTDQEAGFLVDAIWLLPLELGLRFLTDHLLGDVYFKVTTPGQNLQRASIQFALVRSIEQQEAEIRAVGEREFKRQEG